jgi:hypothetical protein
MFDYSERAKARQIVTKKVQALIMYNEQAIKETLNEIVLLQNERSHDRINNDSKNYGMYTRAIDRYYEEVARLKTLNKSIT